MSLKVLHFSDQSFFWLNIFSYFVNQYTHHKGKKRSYMIRYGYLDGLDDVDLSLSGLIGSSKVRMNFPCI